MTTNVAAETGPQPDLVDTGLAVLPNRPTALTPDEIIEQAVEWAEKLADVINKRELYTVIADKKYIEAEGWQLLIQFDRAGIEIEYTKPHVDTKGETIAYECKVNLTKDGEVVSAGVMTCGLEEFPTRGQQGYAKHRAALSSAETWALSKAARIRYSYVMALAGYEVTPAHEMAHEIDNMAAPASARASTRKRQPKTKPADTVNDKTGEILSPGERAYADGKAVDVTGGPASEQKDQPDPVNDDDKVNHRQHFLNRVLKRYLMETEDILPLFGISLSNVAGKNAYELNKLSDEHKGWQGLWNVLEQKLGVAPKDKGVNA